MIFAASIRFFEGRQPRFTHVPPVVRSSVITAVLPSSCARSAAANAVEPEPRMIKSNSRVLVTIAFQSPALFFVRQRSYTAFDGLLQNRDLLLIEESAGKLANGQRLLTAPC